MTGLDLGGQFSKVPAYTHMHHFPAFYKEAAEGMMRFGVQIMIKEHKQPNKTNAASVPSFVHTTTLLSFWLSAANHYHGCVAGAGDGQPDAGCCGQIYGEGLADFRRAGDGAPSSCIFIAYLYRSLLSPTNAPLHL